MSFNLVECNNYSRYEKIDFLGEGQFATVYKVTRARYLFFSDSYFSQIHNCYIQALDKQSKNGRIVAVKKIKLGSRFVAGITSSNFYLKYMHND